MGRVIHGEQHLTVEGFEVHHKQLVRVRFERVPVRRIGLDRILNNGPNWHSLALALRLEGRVLAGKHGADDESRGQRKSESAWHGDPVLATDCPGKLCRCRSRRYDVLRAPSPSDAVILTVIG